MSVGCATLVVSDKQERVIQMNTSLYKIDLGTSPFYCENCGEVTYGSKYQLLDEFPSIPDTIEEICEYCASNL